MTDRELLEKAAKAAGLAVIIPASHQRGLWIEGLEDEWNPLTDDGDALRLAVKLSQMDGGVALCLNSRLNSYGFAQCYTNERVVSPTEDMSRDPYAATRRVIVRSAAEIGAQQEKQHGN